MLITVSTSRWCSNTTAHSVGAVSTSELWKQSNIGHISCRWWWSSPPYLCLCLEARFKKLEKRWEGRRVMVPVSPTLTQLSLTVFSSCEQCQELQGGCELRLKQQTVKATWTPRKVQQGRSWQHMNVALQCLASIKLHWHWFWLYSHTFTRLGVQAYVCFRLSSCAKLNDMYK